uniref:Tryptophan synthase alpha chain n=1 Tax=Polysiphonia sertularioides TaxID=945028 RepID=A0A1Z1MGN1_9FLOR|nr:Tryptophan synthase alpha subunit [Polysiphonia sertularioides]
MKLISKILRENFTKSACSFIPFITAGYPNIELTIKTIIALDKEGADLIELGIPYSDALADGPLIQEASKYAIEHGINIDKVIHIIKCLNNKINTPIIIFTYYNPILVRGLYSFIDEISAIGIKGLIIPDLPFEEADYLVDICNLFDVELILFISPTSSNQRIHTIVNKAPGSLYLVSSTGVTGVRESIDDKALDLSKVAFDFNDKMIMIGFGISSPSHVRKILEYRQTIHGVVVGSAFTLIFSKYIKDNSFDIIENVRILCRSMKVATIS